jgi:hypothetical protein
MYMTALRKRDELVFCDVQRHAALWKTFRGAQSTDYHQPGMGITIAWNPDHDHPGTSDHDRREPAQEELQVGEGKDVGLRGLCNIGRDAADRFWHGRWGRCQPTAWYVFLPKKACNWKLVGADQMMAQGLQPSY